MLSTCKIPFAEYTKCTCIHWLSKPQRGALAATLLSIVLVALGALALAGVYSPAGAFGDLGAQVGEVGAYLMLSSGGALLISLALIYCEASRGAKSPIAAAAQKRAALRQALANGDTAALDTVNPLSGEYTELIDDAVNRGDLKDLDLLLRNQSNEYLNAQALRTAALSGQIGVVKHIESSKISVEDWGVALRLAALKGHTAIIQSILQRTIIDISQYDMGWALRNAVEYSNNLQAVSLLLEHMAQKLDGQGTAVKKAAEEHQGEALMRAVQQGKTAMVGVFLQSGRAHISRAYYDRAKAKAAEINKPDIVSLFNNHPHKE